MRALSLARRVQMFNRTQPFSTNAALKRPSTEPSAAESSAKVPKQDASAFSFSRRLHPDMPQPSPHSRTTFSRSQSGSSTGQHTPTSRQKFPKQKAAPQLPVFDGPLNDAQFVQATWTTPLPEPFTRDPKHAITNAKFTLKVRNTFGRVALEGGRMSEPLYRSTATVQLDPPIVGIGDSTKKKEAEDLACISVAHQLQQQAYLFRDDVKKVQLSDGSSITLDEAKSFMEFYCRRFQFGNPALDAREVPGGWECTMTVGGRKIGLGNGTNKKSSTSQCYLDVVQYLEQCDPNLWKTYVQKSMKGDLPGYAPSLYFVMGPRLNDELRDLCVDIKNSNLYRNRPAVAQGNSSSGPDMSLGHGGRYARPLGPQGMITKSNELLDRRKHYLEDPKLKKMRDTRASLPIYTKSEELLSMISDNDVTICMAATGSGKTTQIPQMILDTYIDHGKGSSCNILCTQPRRLAALSVADRVAKERGEVLGRSIGYQVRFEAKLPEDHGSVTFCTTGVFLKRLQTALAEDGQRNGNLDHITHVVVDEVHERDVDTDLLLVVLKRLLAVRKAQNKPIKVILMSATIDPALFQNYFPDDQGQPAKVIDIPGRSYPVTKYFLDDFLSDISPATTQWLFKDPSVVTYVSRELGTQAVPPAFQPARVDRSEEEADIPYPLVAATIAHVLQKSDSGHVLVFLPGWDDIVATQRNLQNGALGMNFGDTSKFSLHLLHSTIPLAEQQVIFDPPPAGVRRVILSTNIAETSVTIPDVVYVVDTARLKEQRYDPERHIMSLTSAWVGASNLNQRAGRAGRHRPGDYYGILGRARAESLHPYQTVEMSRVDLTNVVMHVKALNFPNMAVEDVLAATIEPPSHERVAAAMKELKMVGALDESKNLTALGRVLLQLPVDVQVGRLVLYGSFFRCLDQALTLAAILTNRDPFVSPMHLKAEAGATKSSWSPASFKSDALAILRSYNAWERIQETRDFATANRFCLDNFLAKPTLLMIQKIKGHILQSLYHAGVLHVSAGGGVVEDMGPYARQISVPPELNENGESLPLLTALIALASQPKFAIRIGEKGFRTQQDKLTFIHPSSVNNRKHDAPLNQDEIPMTTKQVYSFTEKRRNVSVATNGSPMTFLVTTTRLDPLAYVLFGAHKVEKTDAGLKCDDWIPIVGHLDGLEDIYRLKTLVDACMLRVYEGITMSRRKQRRNQGTRAIPREEESDAWEDDDDRDYTLSREEVKELDLLSRDLVGILNKYSEERLAALSRPTSRPATPSDLFSSRLKPTSSSHATPYASRAPTPLGRPWKF